MGRGMSKRVLRRYSFRVIGSMEELFEVPNRGKLRALKNEREFFFEEESGTLCPLFKKDTGLPVNLFIYGSNIWRDRGGKRRVLIQCNRDDKWGNESSALPMSISGNPRLLNRPKRIDKEKIGILEGDIEKVREFVRENRHRLKKIAEGEGGAWDFVEWLRKFHF